MTDPLHAGNGNPRAATPKLIPALRFRALTRIYDRLIRTTLKEDVFKKRLVLQANIEPGHRILDLGCGTGTLMIMIKRACPDATVVGLDGDAEVLDIARRKAKAAGLAVELQQGMAFKPPFEPGSFDRVVSSLVFHHLSSEQKLRALRSARSLLRSRGELHIADWGKAQNALMRAAFIGVQLLDGFATTTDNVRGRLPDLIKQAGFDSVAETHREMTIFGTLSLYSAVAPEEGRHRDTP